MSAVHIVYYLCMVVFSLTVLVAFLSRTAELRPYFRSALSISLLVCVAEVVLLLNLDQPVGYGEYFLFAVVTIRQFMITCVGLYFYDTNSNNLWIRFVQPRRYWLVACLGTILFWISFSTILFEYTQPEAMLNPSPLTKPLAVAAVMLLAVGEEIVFRLGMQNVLRHHLQQDWLAIGISAAVWSMAHWGMVDPNWVKMLQIFLAGLALGWLNLRYGVLMPVVVHAVFNALVTAYA